jgi:hypothetical protein
MKKTYNLIILGAGVSGIGCASQLLKNDYKNFKIISPDIGGRILKSNIDDVNYGSYYIMNIYHHVKKLLSKKRRIWFFDLMFYKNGEKYKVLNKKLVLYFPQLIKLIFILLKFKRHYENFKKNSETESQINCLKKDPYLWCLYNTKTEFFVKENKIQNIVTDYLSEILHGTAFVPIKQLNTFTFLQFSLPLVVPVYEFIFEKENISLLLESNYINDEVMNISKEDNNYKILTKKGEIYYCKNLVSALPPTIAKNLLRFDDILREPISVYMFHISGKEKKSWARGKDDLFDENNKTLAISIQKDGTYLFYTLEKNPNINHYFNHFSILKEKFWDPAFNIGGSNLVNFQQGNNLYVIGDNNICGLEDSYIYGIYAGNKILGKTKD